MSHRLTQVHPFPGLFASTVCPKHLVPCTVLAPRSAASHLSPFSLPISVVGGGQVLKLETDLERKRYRVPGTRDRAWFPVR